MRWILLLLVALLPLVARAEPDRLVARFDFEETNDAGVKLGSGLTLPRSWAPIGRDPGTGDRGFGSVPYHRELVARGGHPVHNPVGYAPDPTDPGGYLLRLGVLAGDVGAYLVEGAAPAEPGGVYRVSLRLRRRGLTHARPRVLGCLLDGRGRRIPGTSAEAAADAPPDAGGWERWTLTLGAAEGGPTSVGSIGLEVSARQPRRDPLDPLGDERVLPLQTSGALEVDAVEVRRLPVAGFTTGHPLEVVRLPDRPELRLNVRDLDAERLTARLSVEDLDGRWVDARVLPVGGGVGVAGGAGGAGGPGGGVVRWRPRLPRLGWYEALAEVLGPSGEVLLERRLPFVHAPVSGRLPGDAGDGAAGPLLDLTDLDLPPAELVDLAAATRFPGVLLAGWTHGLDAGGVPARAGALGAAARDLVKRGMGLEVTLGPVPRGLAATSPRSGPVLADPGPGSALGSASGGGGGWLPWVEPLVVEVGGRADAWWMATPAGVAGAGGGGEEPAPALRRVVLDWSAGSVIRPLVDAARAGGGGTADAVRVFPLGDAGGEEQTGGPARLSIRTRGEPGEPGEPGRRRRVEELADAVLGARLGDPARGLVLGPLVHLAGGEARPDPLLPAAERLCGWAADAGAWVPWDAADGLACWVAPGGVLVARARGAEAATLSLGDAPSAVAVDLWGNRWRPGADASGARVVAVGRLPVRVEGLDPEALALRASFAVDRPALEAVPGPHPREVRFRNPHGSAIRGSLRLEAPEGWTVRPARVPFQLAPGATAALRVEFGFAGNAASGAFRVRGLVEYDLRGPRSLPVQAPVTLGLPGLRLQAALTAGGPGGRDLLATCVAFNDGSEAESLSVFAHAAGQPFRERLAPRVEPGGVAVFRFRFPGAAAGAVPVLAGVRRSGEPGAVNAHLVLDAPR